MRRVLFSLIPMMLLSSPALAQDDNAAVADRLERLERDLSFMQKQVYRNEGGASSAAGATASPGNLQVRLTQVDEEIRQIRGLIEQTQFQNKQTATELKKLQEDMDFRLRALEQKQAAAATPAPTEAAAAPAEAAAATAATTPPAPLDALAADATAKPDTKDKTAAPKDFTDSNAHYTHAFKLLNEKKYAEASASFDAFVKKYPNDPLTANAYYWLGESQYSRNDFTRASESFRKGFEVAPEGNKAADNLYKLAMSLSQVRRKNEACIVLGRVIEKYAESAARTVAKAEEARTSLQCK